MNILHADLPLLIDHFWKYAETVSCRADELTARLTVRLLLTK